MIKHPSSILFALALTAAVWGLRWFLDRRAQLRMEALHSASISSAETSHFFYVMIPGSIAPLERGERFEDPLNDKLEAAGIGEVTGGGSSLVPEGGIEYCGIDVEVTDREKGLEIIIETMRKLKAPKGTVVEEYQPVKQVHPVYEE